MYENRRSLFAVLIPFIASAMLGYSALAAADVELTAMESLGKHIFFDENLSEPDKQSCASCHAPEYGFTSPNVQANQHGGVQSGAARQRAGNRKPPTASYATIASDFAVIGRGNRPVGGLFLDGRATGDVVTDAIFPGGWSLEKFEEMSAHLGPAPDQAMGPFLNPAEQNLPSTAELCARVASSAYADLWFDAWGEEINCSEPVFHDQSHKRIAFAVGVYEASAEVNSFSSPRDVALANDADGLFPLDDFTDAENLGHDLFYDPRIGCAATCHSSNRNADGTDPEELYVNESASYRNIGTPANKFNPWYRMDKQTDDFGNIINPDGIDWVDIGVAFRDDDGNGVSDFLGREGEVRTPTVRNVDKRPKANKPKAFAHNGYFSSLESIVHFYNTRDMKPTCTDPHGNAERFVPDNIAMLRGCWPLAEVQSDNIFDCDAGENCKVLLAEGETYETYCDNSENVRNIGNMCISAEEEHALVVYMMTLSDIFTAEPPAKSPGKSGK